MPSSKTIWMTRWLAVLGLCLVCSTLVSAQSTGGRILGRISDSSGAVLANVKVTVTNEATGVSSGTNTNSSGDYVFPQVSVGTYRMEFDLAGFKKELDSLLEFVFAQLVSGWDPDGISKFLELDCVPIAIVELGRGHRRGQLRLLMVTSANRRF